MSSSSITSQLSTLRKPGSSNTIFFSYDATSTTKNILQLNENLTRKGFHILQHSGEIFRSKNKSGIDESTQQLHSRAIMSLIFVTKNYQHNLSCRSLSTYIMSTIKRRRMKVSDVMFVFPEGDYTPVSGDFKYEGGNIRHFMEENSSLWFPFYGASHISIVSIALTTSLYLINQTSATLLPELHAEQSFHKSQHVITSSSRSISGRSLGPDDSSSLAMTLASNYSDSITLAGYVSFGSPKCGFSIGPGFEVQEFDRRPGTGALLCVASEAKRTDSRSRSSSPSQYSRRSNTNGNNVTDVTCTSTSIPETANLYDSDSIDNGNTHK